MATVTARNLGYERRLPDRSKTAHRIQDAETGKIGRNENQVTAHADGHLVDVQMSGDVSLPGHQLDVEMPFGKLVRAELILQSPDFANRCEVKPVLLPGEAHRAPEELLVNRDLPVRHPADEEQPVALI